MTTENEMPATEPETPITPAAEAPAPETPAAEPAKDERPVAAKALDALKEGAAAETPKPVDPLAAAAPPPKKEGEAVTPTPDAKPDQKVEDEIKSLKLSGKTAERFRELSKRPSAAEVDAQVAPLKARAAIADQWDEVIRDSTARPDQLNSALGYLQAINSGDPVAMNKAYDVMTQEVAWLGKQLGREVGGLYDPLKDHPDLAQKVADGEVTRELALETARHRATSARTTDLTTRREQGEAQTRAKTAAVQAGVNDLNELGRTLKAADPQYDAKAKLLNDAIAYARDNLDPSQWKGFIQREYQKIVLPVAAAPVVRPPVGHVPLRPTGTSAAQVPHTKDPRKAFELGVAEVSQ